ncbi:MAG: preprotein translocase subunit SecA [Phycisphaeraceae bacterium]|nr:preprotein translocase subunit SecA [Phycisphaeraceae bacterium]
MVISTLTKSFRKVFGSRNQRLVKTYFRRVEQVNAFEDEIRALTDAELKAQTAAIRAEVADGRPPVQVIPRALAVAREAMDRAVGIRNIFNPDHGFDRNELPEVVRPRYDNVMEAISRTEPADELGCAEPVPGWQQVDVPNSIYDAVRELHPQSRPPFRARPFDVQLIGGMVLSEGLIAEMKTGEGKTIVAPLACFLACLEGLQCYVVTVNDYLVQRDRDWVFPFYYHLGLTVGAIHPFHMMPPQAKADAYRCNVVYGTNSEFGFDYLRDNMQLSIEEQVQKHRHFCIIDEVDSILIDEARTPLIISGPAHDDAPRYGVADSIARHLMQKQKSWHAADAKVQEAQMRIKGLEGDIRNAREKTKVPAMRDQLKEEQDRLPQIEQERDRHVQYYELEMERKAAHLTHEGIAEAQKQADIGSFYVGNNMDFPHLLENALRAHAVYSRDKDYVVQDGEVVIVDEFTGRLMIGRQWSDGLHQAVEAKERVKIKQETQTLATVTIQNYFKLFDRLAGMTGTAITEATEFNEIYKLDVICIPTNVSVQRDDRNDLIFLSQNDKWNAILDEIKHHHDLGRPVLVGTTSVEKSEALSQKLTKRHGIKHEVLNAKIDQVEREANIVQHAGELGAVMIATNMAGRGTDIRLAPLDRAALIRHWQQRNVMPRGASPEQSDEELRAMAMRHLAGNELDLAARDLEEMDDEQVSLALLRHWAVQQAWVEDDKVGAMSTEQCMAALDGVPSFMMHRLDLWRHVQDMGGLHIVGTERHEARRIDNQLRGRAGRQGDLGSSRFFIALDDDLMQLFAKGWLMRALPKLGMKEGDALEHRMVTRAVERAQRKVEERNYEIRKNLLEYDEVMEHQRNSFYAIRQEVLQ